MWGYATITPLERPGELASKAVLTDEEARRRLGTLPGWQIEDGKLKHTYSMVGVMEFRQESEEPLPTGDVNVQLVFAADEAKPATGGEVTLLVNGEPVASGRMEHTVPGRFSGYSGMDIGRDNGLVVDRSYADKAPFAFTGEIKQVVFDVAPHLSEEDRQALVAGVADGTIDVTGRTKPERDVAAFVDVVAALTGESQPRVSRPRIPGARCHQPP